MTIDGALVVIPVPTIQGKAQEKQLGFDQMKYLPS
jgi:hypothetical protein